MWLAAQLPQANIMRVNSLFKHLTYRVFAPGTVLRKTYEAFQELLVYDNHCHELMAELENYYYQGIKTDFCKITKTYRSFAENVEGMVISLEKMAPTAYHDLPAYFRKFNFYASFFLEPPALHLNPPYVLHFQDSKLSTALVGSKSLKLAQLANELHLPVPLGFTVTTNSFSYFIEYNDLRRPITDLLNTVDLLAPVKLQEISRKLCTLITEAEIPPDIEKEILAAVNILEQSSGTESFAVRSSALSEDGEYSFAGQYLSCLNIDADQILSSYKAVISSKYSPEALVYRINCGLSDEETLMAVMIIPMIEAKSAGVMYTADPSDEKQKTMLIHATHGLGDAVVSGKVCPDEFVVDKTTDAIVSYKKGNKNADKRTLSDEQIIHLYTSGLKIEQHYGDAQDIEWAMDINGSLLFLQARPLQIYAPKKTEKSVAQTNYPEPLFSGGTMAASGTASGNVYRPIHGQVLDDITSDIILILKETLPSYVQMLPYVKGVIAESGSAAGHFSTVCREFGVPLLLVGTSNTIECLEDGATITLDAEQRSVYPGKVSIPSRKPPAHKCQEKLPFYRKLHSLLDFITPLNLVDPTAKSFVPESCRSLHDIIRFSHEKAVQTMFSIGDHSGGLRGVKKNLDTHLPFDVFLVDVDNGLSPDCAEQHIISIDQILSTPFQPLWRGLTHPDITWGQQKYYDWKSYDQIAMSDAFSFQSKSDSATYAIVAKDYLNINIRFGYHFTVIDSLCEQDSTNNYCTLRFAGGGGEFEGRRLRIQFLSKVLTRLDFEVRIKGDLLDASLKHVGRETLLQRLESVGRLLGLTKQMDIRLREESQVEQQLEEFFKIK